MLLWHLYWRYLLLVLHKITKVAAVTRITVKVMAPKDTKVIPEATGETIIGVMADMVIRTTTRKDMVVTERTTDTDTNTAGIIKIIEAMAINTAGIIIKTEDMDITGLITDHITDPTIPITHLTTDHTATTRSLIIHSSRFQ